jgi:hypothetical protein
MTNELHILFSSHSNQDDETKAAWLFALAENFEEML